MITYIVRPVFKAKVTPSLRDAAGPRVSLAVVPSLREASFDTSNIRYIEDLRDGEKMTSQSLN